MRADGLAMQFLDGQVRCARLEDIGVAIEAADGSSERRRTWWWDGGCARPVAESYWDRCNIVTGVRLGPAASGDGVAGC